jgi:hypothetical protein
VALSGQLRSADDGVYRPILRARRGELTALCHVDPSIAARITPVLEPAATAKGPARDTDDLARLIHETRPATPAIAVDLGHLPDPDDHLRSPILDLAEDLAGRDTTMLPVVRAFDSDRRLIEHGLAARMHAGRAVVRFRPRLDAPDAATATRTCERIWRGTGLGADRCDLLVDLADVGCGARAAHVEEHARRIVRWARRHPWRSVTLASGAMPPDLDGLPTDEAVRLWRWDALLWRRVAGPGIGYGDYGVTSPTRRDGIHHRPLPTVRYTADDAWWIYRWARRGARSDDRFADLCRTLVGSAHWPAEGARFSWGDAEIARRARCGRGAGTPSSWTAWATSHHLAHVVAELAGPHDRAAAPPRTVRRRKTG